LASKEEQLVIDGSRGGGEGEIETWMSVDHRWSLLAIVIIVIITMKKIKKKGPMASMTTAPASLTFGER
jgi:hypothetical protein